MKPFAILIFLALIFSLPVQSAELAVQFEKGNVSGSRDYQTGDSTRSDLNDSWDTELKGDATALLISYAEDYGLLYGVGQQTYRLSGDASGSISYDIGATEVTEEINANTTQYKTTGFFGMVGYQWDITENLRIQPQFRLGYANKANIDQSESSTVTTTGLPDSRYSVSSSHSDEVTIQVISLPISYNMGGFFLGAQYQQISTMIKWQTDQEETSYITASAVLLQLGFIF